MFYFFFKKEKVQRCFQKSDVEDFRDLKTWFRENFDFGL